ncbi:MAG: hypothetical protein HOQ32_03295 [Lysobacter sp.]|nr:hypothetical protein [Lysobacter sp.]
MSSAAHTKRVVTLALLAVAVGAVFWLHAAEDRFGPYVCNHCPLQNPRVDPETEKFIDSTRPLWALGLPWEDDDVYVICNATYCVDYRRTYPDDSYEGDNARPMQNGASGGRGGNETGGSTGTGTGGGGCVASCGTGGGGTGTGTVIVREPLPDKQER